jgi:hypothetical protein
MWVDLFLSNIINANKSTSWHVFSYLITSNISVLFQFIHKIFLIRLKFNLFIFQIKSDALLPLIEKKFEKLIFFPNRIRQVLSLSNSYKKNKILMRFSSVAIVSILYTHKKYFGIHSLSTRSIWNNMINLLVH